MTTPATSNEELMAAFEAGTLDPSCFPHREHVRLAWALVRHYPLAEAAARFTAGIRALATRAGKPEKYHETITWAYLLLITDRVARDGSSAASWETFAAANADLIANGRGLLESWYHPSTLDSPLARDTFIWPDRRP